MLLNGHLFGGFCRMEGRTYNIVICQAVRSFGVSCILDQYEGWVPRVCCMRPLQLYSNVKHHLPLT